MKIAAIKSLVEERTLEALRDAEAKLMDEHALPFEVPGVDEGEQLTHLMAAIWINTQMRDKGVAFPEALRAYTQRVRVSLS